MVVDIAYSTIIAFFLCWWLLGLLLQAGFASEDGRNKEVRNAYSI
jgi:hypothetical protein